MHGQLICEQCPYCGEVLELLVDDYVPDQRYIEDCYVCCCPIEVLTWSDTDEGLHVRLQRDDE